MTVGEIIFVLVMAPLIGGLAGLFVTVIYYRIR